MMLPLVFAVLLSYSTRIEAAQFRDNDKPTGNDEENTTSSTQTMKDLYPWLTPAADLRRKIEKLQKACGNEAEFLVQDVKNATTYDGKACDPDKTVQFIRIKSKGQSNTTTMKAMFFFGVHSRELISAESGMHFLETLCGEHDGAKQAKDLLNKVEFVVIPNANPYGRAKVETGDFCKRTNEHGVDINRNWGFDGHQDPEKKGQETNPGPHSFSEPESVALRELVEKEKPGLFLDVHAGSYLLGTPWGYDPEKVPQNEAALLEVLAPIAEKYCDGQCPYGNAAELVGYPAPGTEMDFLKEKVQTPYAYSWEIYVGEDFRGRYINLAEQRKKVVLANASLSSLAEENSTSGKKFLHRRTQNLVSDCDTILDKDKANDTQKSTKTSEIKADIHDTKNRKAGELKQCMDQFNPPTAEETATVVKKWSNAYLDLCSNVLAHRAKDQDGKETTK